MTDESRETKDEGLTKKPVSRREFLKYAGVAGGVVAVSGGLGGLIAACGSTTTTTTAGATTTTAGATTTTAAGATTTTAAAETTTTAAGATVVTGGRVRHIVPAGPQDVGFWPKMGPTDEGPIFPSVERINEYTVDRTLVPHLAKTFVEDPEKLTMTCELKPGILFHDGTELTADVAKWNYQIGIDGKKLQFADALDSFEVTGKYTYVLHLKRWDNQLINSFGWVPMFSQAAFEKNGGEAWAMDHCVGTGPFVMKEFVRDQSITWEKFADYWQKPLPNTDGIDYKIIPDATTSGALMQSGQADIWQNADAQAQNDMKQAGLIDQSGWAAFLYHLMPNTMDETAPTFKLPVREAVEYALDKEAICKAVGYGIYKPIYEVAPEGEWGAGSAKVKRTYDPAKAKQLLADAGYANGCPIDLLAIAETGGRSVVGEACKGYLDAAGFQTNLDIADPGRFYGSVFGTGWKNLALMFSGTDPNYLISSNRWWSPTPMTNLVSFKRPPEFTQMFEAANSARDPKEQEKLTGPIVGMMADQALMVPVYSSPAGLIMQKYVHTEYPLAGFIRWDWANFWMDKH
jgi:peptide/nickel transport system substrate-binding protein